MGTIKNINHLPRDGEVFFFPNFFEAEEADYFLDALINGINWKQEPIMMFGKEIMQPRLTAWLGEDGKVYRYSGGEHVSPTVDCSFNENKKKIEPLAGTAFNSALLNQYRDGNDSMGWHRDNEKELGSDPVIASVSFGVSRKFLMRHYVERSLVQSFNLSHGSFLLMKGKTQHHWQHSVPKTAKHNGARVNITFRIIV